MATKGGFDKHPENINKNGRPKKAKTMTGIIHRILREKVVDLKLEHEIRKYFPDVEVVTFGFAAAFSIVFKAIKGDTAAQRLLMQYVDGLPTLRIEQETGVSELSREEFRGILYERVIDIKGRLEQGDTGITGDIEESDIGNGGTG